MTDNLPTIIDEKETQAQKDFVKVRQNLLNILTVTEKAVEEAADLAEQSQSDKYYIALNQLLKTNVETNRELLGTHETIKKIDGAAKPETVNNTLVITSAKMLELIKGDTG